MAALPFHGFQGRRLYINDVAMRDGLQIEPVFVPTEDKIALVNALSRTGLAKIEVTSRSQAVLWAIQHGLLMSGDAATTGPRIAAAHPARV